MAKREDEIKVMAYNIWEEQGCPDGRDCEHWFLAESQWEEKQKKAAKETPGSRNPSPSPKKPGKK